MADAVDRLKVALADRYTIERELGAGGMATVYLARDLKHERQVAVKVLRPEIAASIGPERFLREMKITAALTHPHVLPLLDSGEAEGFLFYAMPYVAGESLRERLNREKQLPVEDAVQLTCEIADALNYAHEHNIIHRDVKPENVLLEAGHAVVVDFGIARAITTTDETRLTETGITVGTPHYLSPEQAAGERNLDGRSDIYALGCVLFEMLAGRAPFLGPTAESIVHQHLGSEPPRVTELRPAVPKPVVSVVSKALAKAPADRYATAAKFSEALSAPSSEQIYPATPILKRRGSFHRLVLCAGAFLGLIVLAWWAVTTTRSVAAESRSIAVLPCETPTNDSAGDFVGDRWTEEIIGKFTKVPAIAVKSWPTVAHLRAPSRALTLIADELRVGYLVWCRVTLRDSAELSTQVIRGDNEDMVASASFRDELSARGINAVQANAVRDIAAALGAPISGAELRRVEEPLTRNDSALTHFRLARHYWLNQMTEGALQRSIDYYQRAVELDPEFAMAYVGWAQATTFHGQLASLPTYDYMPDARRLTRRALDIDSTVAEAHSTLARILFKYDWDWGGAEREHRLAIELDPNSADARWSYAQDLGTVGRHEEAIEQMLRAVQLEPTDVFVRVNLAFRYHMANRLQEALDEVQHAIDLNPAQFTAYWAAGMTYMDLADHDRAIQAMQRAYELSGESAGILAWLGRAYADAGMRDEAERVLADLRLRSQQTHVAPCDMALVFAGLGELDSAITYLEQAFRNRSLLLLDYLSAAVMKDVHDDPRFQEMRRLVGFDEW